ncbi:hypothetical protein [Micromonospora sp. NPDC126480]
MSGRRLGRLLGSLLVLSAVAVVGVSDFQGDLHLMDYVWTLGIENGVVLR